MKYILSLAALGIMALGMVGCSNEITAQRMREEMPKELATPAETKGQVDNRIAYTATRELRGFNEDLLRFMLLDRPSPSIEYPDVGD